jgi:uncharacterized protein
MSSEAGDKSFLGTGWAFPPRLTSRGAVMVSAERDIRESLLILLATNPGERIMHPTYGCGLKMHVFDIINESAIAILKDVVRKAILYFEPRVILDRIDIAIVDELNGRVDIHLDYRVSATNNRYNLVYPFYINDGAGAELPAIN